MLEGQKDTEDVVVVAMTTFADADQARQVGTQIVERQLVACFQILPGVESIYQWKGDLEVEGECLCLLKTAGSRVAELERWLRENHPYEEPEFVVMPAVAGSEGYFDWVRGQVASKQ